MGERVLVIGGTGPTGTPLVRGLHERGHQVTILHTGAHENEETPPEVTHVHADPYRVDDLAAALHGSVFDTVVSMYGRLRAIAALVRGRCGRFVSVGGVPAYRGWMDPWAHRPYGLPVPVAEEAATVTDPASDEKGYRVARTEQAVFEHHPEATHFRYPYLYGPRQVAPREWSVVRRVLDGRRRIVLPDDGLTLHHHGYTLNVAHALLLALDQPRATGIYNVGDSEVLTVRQVVELCATALGHEFDIVSMPYDLALPARPLLAQPLPTHRVLDLTRLHRDLGHRDPVPARQAVADTARWLAAHPPRPGGREETVLTDPFDYPAEDRLMDAWQQLREALPQPADGAPTPGWGLAYSGPGGRPRKQATFVP